MTEEGGGDGYVPGPCVRMDMAAPSRQQLERDQYTASPLGAEPQGPGKRRFGGFQPLPGTEATPEGDWDSAGRGPLRHTAPHPQMHPEEKRDESWGVSLPGLSFPSRPTTGPFADFSVETRRGL